MDKNDKYNTILKTIFFSTLAGGSILFGFSRTLKAPKEASGLYAAGSALARKALFRATIYSVAGFSVFSYASYKLFGQQMIANFRGGGRSH